MNTYIPLSDAARLIQIPEIKLHQLVQVGKIEAVKTVSGEILVSENGIGSFVWREQFEHLSGRPIGIAEAARKYGLPHATVSRWKSKGYLRVLMTQGQKILIDEADIAYCAAVHRQTGGFGHWAVKKSTE